MAILLDINTDNRNRTVSEIRHVFGKNGGNMAVSWRSRVYVPQEGRHHHSQVCGDRGRSDEYHHRNNGEDEPIDDGENWEILTATSAYEGMLEALKKAGIEPASSSVSMIPDTYIKLEGQQASTMIRLMEALEDHDDVQNVHSNFDIDQKLLEEVAG